MRGMNRWVIATAGVFFQTALGAVYAWSVFRTPLAHARAGAPCKDGASDLAIAPHDCPAILRLRSGLAQRFGGL